MCLLVHRLRPESCGYIYNSKQLIMIISWSLIANEKRGFDENNIRPWMPCVFEWD